MSTALYRRYRPESFAEVIGQEHVTAPLRAALRNDRVSHAYLFSGPRGCGKTTSARILARCLNCSAGPTDTPCGACPSCVDLARGGSGSLDVIEIDAASHGGVDDARELRERATYAPSRDRFKIFIIDEAHMVTPAGFNALLKIVEEPPEHIKFIFATTEPEKVIGTIRSRTHHYPFRLVPPAALEDYLQHLCVEEDVPVEPGVVPLVVRAGGGSVRDSLSILDQLMAGADGGAVGYELAVSLLGFTHSSLLDSVVDGVAARDSATVFSTIDQIIRTGHDPRRFVEDLLERFRDLIVVAAVPEEAQSVFPSVPQDQLARMVAQSGKFGPVELSRLADVTNDALSDMTGATSPRLHLELLAARLLLPTSDQGELGVATRVERLERRLGGAAGPAPAADTPTSAPQPPATQPAPAVPTVPTVPTPQGTVSQRSAPPKTADPESLRQEQPSPAPSALPATPPAASVHTAPEDVPAPEPQESEAPRPEPRTTESAAGQHAAMETLRQRWPEVLAALARIKRASWVLVSQNANLSRFDGQELELSFTTSGLAEAFNRDVHKENLATAIDQTLGITCAITTAGAPSAPPPPPASRTSGAPSSPSAGDVWNAPSWESQSPPPAPEAQEPPARGASVAGAGWPGGAPGSRVPSATADPSRTPWEASGSGTEAPAPYMSYTGAATPPGAAAGNRPPVEGLSESPDQIGPDDETMENSVMYGPKVVEELLGGRVVAEIPMEKE